MNEASLVLCLWEPAVTHSKAIHISAEMHVRDFMYEMLIPWALGPHSWLSTKHLHFDVLLSLKLHVKHTKCMIS